MYRFTIVSLSYLDLGKEASSSINLRLSPLFLRFSQNIKAQPTAAVVIAVMRTYDMLVALACISALFFLLETVFLL